MLEKSILLIFIMVFPVFLNGQDSIYKKDNALIVCLIQDRNDSIVQYLPIGKPDSEIHFLSVSYIDSIRFQNGQLEKFNIQDYPVALTPQKGKRNYLGIGLVDPLLYTNLRFTYERRNVEGSVGLFIPVTIGLEHEYYDTERSLLFRTGLGMNFHVPRKKGPSFYIIGISVLYGNYYLHAYYGPGENDYKTVINLTNSHSFHIRITDSIILAPGFEIHPIGWFKSYGLELLYPFPYSFRLDVLFKI